MTVLVLHKPVAHSFKKLFEHLMPDGVGRMGDG